MCIIPEVKSTIWFYKGLKKCQASLDKFLASLGQGFFMLKYKHVLRRNVQGTFHCPQEGFSRLWVGENKKLQRCPKINLAYSTQTGIFITTWAWWILTSQKVLGVFKNHSKKISDRNSVLGVWNWGSEKGKKMHALTTAANTKSLARKDTNNSRLLLCVNYLA